jgi:hypothetical protein
VPKIPVITIARLFNPDTYEIRIPRLNTNPIRAANIFGPAFISNGFANTDLAIFFDKNANGLKRDKYPVRREKSIKRNITGKILPVIINTVRNNIVNAPFNRATWSSIFLLDMGQKVVIFILQFVCIFTLQRYAAHPDCKIPLIQYFLYPIYVILFNFNLLLP